MKTQDEKRQLTEVELKVLSLLAQGYTFDEASGILGKARKTLEKQAQICRRKLGVPRYICTQSIIPILALNISRLKRTPTATGTNHEPNFSPRERKVFRLLTSGKRCKQVAKALGLSYGALASAVYRIRNKVETELGLGFMTLVELAHYAIGRGITPLLYEPKPIKKRRGKKKSVSATPG